jgi:cytochrome c oxidase assembly protein Cox11
MSRFDQQMLACYQRLKERRISSSPSLLRLVAHRLSTFSLYEKRDLCNFCVIHNVGVPAPRNIWPNSNGTVNLYLVSGRRFQSNSQSRLLSTSSQQDNRQQQAQRKEQKKQEQRQRNQQMGWYMGGLTLFTISFTYASVPLYRIFCQKTGFAGTVKTENVQYENKAKPVSGKRLITVRFNADVADALKWKFLPQQHEIKVVPGEAALAFYTATNRTDEHIIGVASYNVQPEQAAVYFNKIQCFCFEEQVHCLLDAIVALFFMRSPLLYSFALTLSVRADAQAKGEGGHARLLLPRSGLPVRPFHGRHRHHHPILHLFPVSSCASPLQTAQAPADRRAEYRDTRERGKGGIEVERGEGEIGTDACSPR